MCVSPCNLPEIGPVACRYCWQCRKNRVNDLVGRCIAESHTADHTLAVTLTYAGDVPNAATLVYKDVQDFFKRLRKAGYDVRYIVTGEYGSLKGRAHWHSILFFRGKAPDVELEKRIDWKIWGHGVVYFQRPDYGAFSYALKYVLKHQKDETARSHLAMSKRPPLGHEFFIARAQSYVDARLSPQSPEYSFRDVFDSKAKRRKFWLQGRMRELFIEHYVNAYREAYGVEYPYSEFIEMQEDKWVRENYVMTDEEWHRHLTEGRVTARIMEPETFRYNHDAYAFVPAEVSEYLAIEGTDMLVVRYKDGAVDLLAGDNETWHVENADQLARALDGTLKGTSQLKASVLEAAFPLSKTPKKNAGCERSEHPAAREARSGTAKRSQREGAGPQARPFSLPATPRKRL